MKKIAYLLVFIVFLFSTRAVIAADVVKPKVVVLYSDILTGSQKERQEVQKIFLDNLSQRLATYYNLVLDDGLSNKLAEAGFNEPVLAERGDLVPIFKAQNVDYAIIVHASDYVYTALGLGGGEYIYSLRLKVIDVNQNKYLFDGRHYLTQKTTTQIKRYIGDLYVETEKREYPINCVNSRLAQKTINFSEGKSAYMDGLPLLALYLKGQ